MTRSPAFSATGWGFADRRRALTPRLPAGVAPEDVLFLWDPRASFTRDWAGAGQTLTATGAITETERNGHPCASLASAAYYTAPTSPIPTYSAATPWTAYAVAETTSDGKTLSYLFQVSDTNITAGSASLWLRDTASTGAGAALISDTNDILQAASHTGTGVAATPGRVYQATAEFGVAAIQAWMDGFSAGSIANAHAPTGMANCYLGGSGTATGQALNEGCHLYYVLALAGARDAAVEAWLSANLPVGMTA